jgi:hypothetical protein
VNIKSIIIELEPEGRDSSDHATKLEFKNGMWTFNGPVYPRIAAATSEFCKLLKGQR